MRVLELEINVANDRTLKFSTQTGYYRFKDLMLPLLLPHIQLVYEVLVYHNQPEFQD